MRFEREEAVESRSVERREGFLHLPVPLSGGYDPARAGESILDVHVLDVRPRQRVSFCVGPDPALHEVRRVPRGPQGGRVDAEEYMCATDRDVAVDLLLVLVQERDAGALCLVCEHAHLLQDLVLVYTRLVSIGDEEREDADVRRLHDIGGVQGAPEALQVGSERVGYRYLAYR